MAAFVGIVAILLLEAALLGRSVGSAVGEKCNPGATRCDAIGRFLSECDADGAWARSTDCAAVGLSCVDGRCSVLSNAARNTRASCETPNALSCNENCTVVMYCNSNYVQIPAEECDVDDDKFCVQNAYNAVQCGSVGNGFTLPCTNNKLCKSKGKYPEMNDCAKYIDCNDQGYGTVRDCGSGEQFNPCVQSCVKAFLQPAAACQNLHKGCSEIYETNISPMNPSLYYTCDGDKKYIWDKCEKGFYIPQLDTCYDPEKCTESNDSGGSSSTGGSGGSGGSGDSSSEPTSTTTETPCNGVGTYPIEGTVCAFRRCSINGESTVVPCAPNYAFTPGGARCESRPGACLA